MWMNSISDSIGTETGKPLVRLLTQRGVIAFLVCTFTTAAFSATPQPTATASMTTAAATSPLPATVPSTPAAAPKNPTEPKKYTVPLTIEQIRANLPPSTAERFEFLRRQRKVTLEAIDEMGSQVKALTAS